MLAVALLAALGLFLVASKVASPRTAATTPSQAARPGSAVVVPPPPPLPGQVATITPSATPTPATSGGPPGLLLRREPEIRGLPNEAVDTYVRIAAAWVAAGNVPTEAWRTSLAQARAELLLRSRVRRSTGDLTDEQVSALLLWLLRLQQAGMPINSDEQGLFQNLQEERRWRASQGTAPQGGTSLDRAQAIIEEMQESNARQQAELDAIEAEVRR